MPSPSAYRVRQHAKDVLSQSSGAADTRVNEYVCMSPTIANGRFIFRAANNGAARDVILTHAAMGQATNISIPDPGAATADVVLNKGDQSIAGAKTFTGVLKATNLPAANPNVAGQLWNDAGTVKVSAG